MEIAGSGLLRRYSSSAFSADSASLIISCSLRTLALGLFCANMRLASAACFCLSYFGGSGICLSIEAFFIRPWMVVLACVLCAVAEMK